MTENPAASDVLPTSGDKFRAALFVGVVVYFCSIFGILTSPPGVLAAYWPTNAVLLGILIRRSRPPNWLDWLSAFAGYLVSDLVMAHSLSKGLLLICTNLPGVITGYLIFSRQPKPYRTLRHPRAMPRFVLGVLGASAAAGTSGIFVHPILFGGSPAYGFAFWFCTELVSYMGILPVLLTMPNVKRWLKDHRRRADWPSFRLDLLAPLLAFAVSLGLGVHWGGPGAILYAVPAMLWCALTYSLFATAGITLFFCMWTLLAISSGVLQIGAAVDSPLAVMSLRVGLSLTALAPLTVASVMVARNELLERLQHAASHDFLTHVLNRSGFLTQAGELLATPQLLRHPVAVLMMDIDHFKKVNDTYGHDGGDQVLASFATVAQSCLRGGDLLGRLGGEEFAVLLPGCSAQDAYTIAQRICDAFAAHTVALRDGRQLNNTVSIGVCCAPRIENDIAAMLSAADTALYRAKENGRNRVELA
ncbi:GGDEF domain-containing protein [Pseudoduganella ginsengisoli]|uniref:diguanylate cyclase n=1 Tax=Pseudoduganella ginsengisoli TaxID=1462440 RepID=A0A6L6PUU3_9BURK|nr:GGDEF domain-containing protein [Pseudoduganella ginsengisoli]MTW01001.1 diguanylate cyclase [Pseudoduganella ginsengisoli]